MRSQQSPPIELDEVSQYWMKTHQVLKSEMMKSFSSLKNMPLSDWIALSELVKAGGKTTEQDRK